MNLAQMLFAVIVFVLVVVFVIPVVLDGFADVMSQIP